jgi:predicted N-acetyltransferase YhbS
MLAGNLECRAFLNDYKALFSLLFTLILIGFFALMISSISSTLPHLRPFTHAPSFGATIRKATLSDVSELAQLALAVAPDDTHIKSVKRQPLEPNKQEAMNTLTEWVIKRTLKKQGNVTFVAHEGDDLVGSITLKPFQREAIQPLIRYYGKPKHGTLASFEVLKAFRGQGIGRQLIEAAEKQAKENGMKTLAFSCSDQNVAMYEHLGYRQAEGAEKVWLKAPLLNWMLTAVMGYPNTMVKSL